MYPKCQILTEKPKEVNQCTKISNQNIFKKMYMIEILK